MDLMSDIIRYAHPKTWRRGLLWLAVASVVLLIGVYGLRTYPQEIAAIRQALHAFYQSHIEALIWLGGVALMVVVISHYAPRLTRWLLCIVRYGVAGGALAFIGLYLWVVRGRLLYPFSLEWMEASMIGSVMWVQQGQPLYAAPALEHIAHIYTPLYFYVAAALGAFFPLDLPLLRVISLVASLGCFALLFRIVQRETSSPWAGCIATGFYAATFALSGAWFDLARIDSLMMLLMLAAIYGVRFSHGHAGIIGAAIVLVLAFLTKQTALALLPAFLIYLALYRWRLLPSFALMGFIGIAGSTLLFDALYQGWYSYYVFELPRQHALLHHMVWQFWSHDLLPVWIVLVMAALWVIISMARRCDERVWFYGLVAGAMIGASLLSRVHSGGYLNVLMPAFAALALLSGLAAHVILRQAARFKLPVYQGVQVLVYGVLAGQLALLIYDPAPLMPTQADAAAGYYVVQQLERVPGDVLSVTDAYLPVLAGKNLYVQGMPLYDVLRGTHAEARQLALQALATAMQQRQFDAILVNDDGLSALIPAVDTYYPHFIVLEYSDGAVFWPITGAQTRPSRLRYVDRINDAHFVD